MRQSLSRNADGSQWQIQVCANFDDPGTLARECRALQAAAGKHPAGRQLLLTAESRLPFPTCRIQSVDIFEKASSLPRI